MARRVTGGAEVAIRRATARDARRLTALVTSSGAYEGPYASMVAGYRVGPDYIEAHEVFVAAESPAAPGGPAATGAPGTPPGGRVLGFYALVLTPPEPELDLLFVADAAQGRGIGRRLVEHMKATARAAGAEHVHVVSHPPAEGFYTSVGAYRTGISRARPPAVPWDRPELAIPTSS
ncbi:GNAT family N-acetyltransferase [Streptomyces fuscigenes]|uniref:GNAT family N-acetyltransferase n=1 Tax=Streptomyces fuscigenes TaxID=1528880 RepID=UPI001F1C740E|nr:GNAT family N-acetyltransferase [Streptomyces fuscigenes]MCF3963331.1 GNAT family N-acetyltransferase [Streptomyces fuscigenes]